MPARRPRSKGVPGYVRAALAYADLDQTTAGQKLGVSASTINRWMTSSPPDSDTLAKISEVCGVPIEFFDRGFWGAEPTDDGRRRLRQLERQIVSLSERIAVLEDGQRRTLTREQAEVVLGELFPDAKEAQPSSRARSRGRRRAAG